MYTRYPEDSEAAIFYTLALNEAVTVLPPDKNYTRQPKAAAILLMTSIVVGGIRRVGCGARNQSGAERRAPDCGIVRAQISCHQPLPRSGHDHQIRPIVRERGRFVGLRNGGNTDDRYPDLPDKPSCAHRRCRDAMQMTPFRLAILNGRISSLEMCEISKLMLITLAPLSVA